MKIGIISINAHTKVLNFASPLHSYVFQQFLKKNDIESTIIDYKPVYYGAFDVRHPLDYYKKHPNKNQDEQKRLLDKWEGLYHEREVRYDKFEEFINKYYVKTDKCYTAKILETEDAGFDCYICVTDVIWKYSPNTGFDRGYLLACKSFEGKKKIAYSASRGAKTYTPNQAKEFFEYISDIDRISVREKSLQNYIQEHSDLPVTHVLDPVFLMDADFYNDLAVFPEKRGYVLIYIVMEKSKKLVETAVRFAEALGLEVIELSEDMENEHIPEGTYHKVIYDIGVEEWLGYMQNAEYIFTNSFHACCFSIIMEKQFFVGARAGDKIDSVLALFGLSDRRIKGVATEQALEMKQICYEKVRTIKEQYVKESSKFILDAIHDLEKTEHTNSKHLVDFEKLDKDIQDEIDSGEAAVAVDVKKAASKDTKSDKNRGFMSRVKRKVKKMLS